MPIPIKKKPPVKEQDADGVLIPAVIHGAITDLALCIDDPTPLTPARRQYMGSLLGLLRAEIMCCYDETPIPSEDDYPEDEDDPTPEEVQREADRVRKQKLKQEADREVRPKLMGFVEAMKYAVLGYWIRRTEWDAGSWITLSDNEAPPVLRWLGDNTANICQILGPGPDHSVLTGADLRAMDWEAKWSPDIK